MSGAVKRFESSTKKGRFYTVQRAADGSLYCDCPKWRFQPGVDPKDRLCKHTKEVYEAEEVARAVARINKAPIEVQGEAPQPPPDPSTVKLTENEIYLATHGQMITAIKELRQRTYLGLREAKMLVDEAIRKSKVKKVPRRRGAYWTV